MNGVLRAQGGTVSLFGEPVSAQSRRDIARRVAVVPQSEHAAFPFTVQEIVLMGRAPHLPGALSSESGEDRAIATQALRDAGMESFAHREFGTLSGGERQLVLFARALCQQPRLLLLDEPTASLDLAHQQRLLRLAADLHRRGVTVVMVSHDLNLAALHAGRIAVLHNGNIVRDGAPRDVIDDTLLRGIYGADGWIAASPDGAPIVGLCR